jgi:hypothetical protein
MLEQHFVEEAGDVEVLVPSYYQFKQLFSLLLLNLVLFLLKSEEVNFPPFFNLSGLLELPQNLVLSLISLLDLGPVVLSPILHGFKLGLAHLAGPTCCKQELLLI